MREPEKTIIIANTSEAFGKQMQRSEDTQAGRIMIEHTHTLGMRALLWEKNHKVVITSYPVPKILLEKIITTLDWNDVVNMWPERVGMNLSEDIINDPALFERLVQFISENCGAVMTAYATTPEFAALVDLLMASGLEVCLMEKPTNVDLVGYLDSKAGFREVVGELSRHNKDVKIPEGYICRTQEEAIVLAQGFFDQGRSAVIKDNKGVSGWGSLILNRSDFLNREALGEFIEQTFAGDGVWEVGPYVVEEMIDVDTLIAGGSPSTEVYIDKNGPRITYYCEQVVNSAGEFFGVGIGRDCLPLWLQKKIERLVIAIGQEYYRLGYRGFLDVDKVVSRDKEVFAVETNIRRTGGTHVYDLGRAIWGEDQTYWGYLLSEDAFRYGKNIHSAEEIFTVANRWLYQKGNDKEGVVICMIDPVDPVIGYIVVAKNKERALEIQKAFRLIW